MMPARTKHSARPDRGFTLLEMLIAVTLVAMMAVGLWSVFRISIRSWSRGTESIDANQHHRSILDLVRKQMASAYGLIASENPQPGLSSSLVFRGTENSLHFISLNSLHFQESPGLTFVAYEVAQDSNGDLALVEKESRYLGAASEQEVWANQAAPTPVFRNLSSCTFAYFDPGDGNSGEQWVQEWDGPTLRRLPQAISITMESRDPTGNTLNRRMIVPIHAEAVDFRTKMINPFGNRRAVVQ